MNFAEKYGQWALIAGASEGTGAEFARQVAAQGMNCILVARRQGPLDVLAAELAATGVECVTAAIDLCADDSVAQMANAVGDRAVGLLILNAGADDNGAKFLDNSIANWDALAMRNVMTVMRACHHFAAPMVARKKGGIMLVGSGACYGGLPGIGVYCATKAFDLMLGEALWAELKDHGIDVLNLIMGRTDTPAHRALAERLGHTFDENCASAADVAAYGLARLPHGPVANWALADEEVGYAGQSAAQRRDRILAIMASSKQYAKSDG